MSNVLRQKKQKRTWSSNRIPFGWIPAVPVLLFVIGFILNAVVMAANNGQMPVLVPGGCTSNTDFGTHVHTCMTAASHLKFLADWIVLHDGIASPGDFFLWTGDWLMQPMLFAWVALLIYKVRGVK